MNSQHNPVPRSTTDEERLASRRAISPRAALMELLDRLDEGIPGAAAFQAARRLLAENGALPEKLAPLAGSWDAASGTWTVDHAAAMRLWSPTDGDGLPPWKMVDALLSARAEHTGSDDERRLIETLYAEAAQADRGTAAMESPAPSRADATAVAERYGYGDFVEAISLDSSARGFGGAAVLEVFMFVHGIVLSIDGVLDAYAWPDLDLVENDVAAHTGIDYRPTRQRIVLLGPAAGSTQFRIPSSHHNSVIALATAGGATIR